MSDTALEPRQADGRPIPLHELRPGPKTFGPASHYTDDKASMICAFVSEGLSLRKITAQQDMPTLPTLLKWLRERPEFFSQYSIAKQMAAEVMAGEVIDIADDSPADEAPKTKLRMSARQWNAAKWLPKRYGEKVEVEHTIAAGQEDQTAICRRMAYLLARNTDVPQLGSTPVIDVKPDDTGV